MFTQLFPIIATPDLERAVRFYRDAVGARVTYEFRAPDGTLGYVGLEVGGSPLGIGLDAGPPSAATARPISLWLYTDDCDAAVDRLRASGAPLVEEPTDQPWGERVARVRDLDGNELVIGARMVASDS